MNFEKLKPWNWFKHEDDTSNQVPISKNQIKNDLHYTPAPNNPALGSILQLQNEMDRLFDNVWRSFDVPSSTSNKYPISNVFENLEQGNYRAKLDVCGSDKEYEVSVDLPGFSEEGLSLDLRGNVLTVKAEKEDKQEHQDKQYYRIERSIGSVQRTLSLPDDADKDNISAKFKNGLLVITIPRTELPKDDIKRISITS